MTASMIDPSPIRNKISVIIGQFKKKFDDLQMQYDERWNAPRPGRPEAGHRQVGESLHRSKAQALGR